MKILRKGDQGPEVHELQSRLVAAGFSLKVDGRFGSDTDTAVRTIQRKRRLLPDGIAGPKTLAALGIEDVKGSGFSASRILADLYASIGSAGLHAANLAKVLATPFQSSRPASQFRISDQAIEFIYDHEAYPNLSNRLHWPRGASGVTLGPGYDMKERSGDNDRPDVDRDRFGDCPKGCQGRRPVKKYRNDSRGICRKQQAFSQFDATAGKEPSVPDCAAV